MLHHQHSLENSDDALPDLNLSLAMNLEMYTEQGTAIVENTRYKDDWHCD